MAHLNTVGKPMILVVGAGAVGTTLAAYLMKARQSVRLLIRERDMEKFQAAPQLTVERIACLLYTSPSPRDGLLSRMPSSA